MPSPRRPPLCPRRRRGRTPRGERGGRCEWGATTSTCEVLRRTGQVCAGVVWGSAWGEGSMQSAPIPSGKEGSSVIGEKLVGELCDVDQRRDGVCPCVDSALSVVSSTGYGCPRPAAPAAARIAARP